LLKKVLIFLLIVLGFDFVLFYACCLLLSEFFKIFYALITSIWFHIFIYFIVISRFIFRFIILLNLKWINLTWLGLYIFGWLFLYLFRYLLRCIGLFFVFRFVHILKSNFWICLEISLICRFTYLFFYWFVIWKVLNIFKIWIKFLSALNNFLFQTWTFQVVQIQISGYFFCINVFQYNLLRWLDLHKLLKIALRAVIRPNFPLMVVFLKFAAIINIRQ